MPYATEVTHTPSPTCVCEPCEAVSVGNNTSMESMAVLLLLIILKGLLFISSGVEYYVKPTLDTECPEPCHTLSHYIPMTPLVPNVTFHFLPGVFTLKGNGLLWIRNANGIALIGSEQYTVDNLTNDGYQYHINSCI